MIYPVTDRPTWIPVEQKSPPISDSPRHEKPYVLAVDLKNRMSVGYALSHSTGYIWVFAKPIGEPTHWMPLPEPPNRDACPQSEP